MPRFFIQRPVFAWVIALFIILLGVTAILLAIEHGLVWGSRTRRIHIAFLTVNGLISLLLGVLGIFDAVRSVI